MPLTRTPVDHVARFTTRTMSRIVLAVAVVGCVVGTVLLVAAGGTPSSRPDIGEWLGDGDVASSWGRYNAGVAESEPAWTIDEFAAAAEGATAGQIVQMPGSISYLDASPIEAAIAGTDLLVVATPPSPLGATETTRIRDNTVQKYWADDRGIQLVMVHGTNVYVPNGAAYGKISGTTADPGEPAVNALLCEDATNPVLNSIAWLLEGHGFDEYDEVPTAAVDLAPSGRAPTSAELAPVLDALTADGVYIDPKVPNPPAANASWPGLGSDAMVAIFPSAEPGEYVDYATAIHQHLPEEPVVVVTGNWIQTAGLDDQRAFDVMMHLGAVGGFPLAGSAPDPQRLLMMFEQIYQVASASAAVHTGVPAPAEGIPRWVALLVLGASLTIVVGFSLGALLESRARRREPWQTWRDRVGGALLDRYVALSTAVLHTIVSDSDTAAARSRIDDAYGMLLEVRGTALRISAIELIQQAWRELDLAAAQLDRVEIGPTQVLAAQDRNAPPALWQATENDSDQARKGSRGRVLGWAGGLLAVGLLVVFASGVIQTPASGTSLVADRVTSGLRTSSAYDAVVNSDVDLDGVREAIGTRWLILVYAEGDSYDLAESVADAYPDSVVFVINDGKIDGSRIGAHAEVDGYDVYSLIEDYYDVQSAAGTEPVAQARQLALLYDRLAAEGSINGIDRVSFAPAVPWTAVAAGMVAALALAAFLIYAATSRVSAARSRHSDETGRREALQQRIGETATQLLSADAAPLAVLADLSRRHLDLMQEVRAADPAQFDALRVRIDSFDDEVNGVLAGRSGA